MPLRMFSMCSRIRDRKTTILSDYRGIFRSFSQVEPRYPPWWSFKQYNYHSYRFCRRRIYITFLFRIIDPIAGSPTITLLRLFLPPIQSIRSNSPWQILATHNQYQSEETTGGVYKRQGRIQHAILEHAYKGFLVQVRKLQKTIPFTGRYSWFTPLFSGSNTFYRPL